MQNKAFINALIGASGDVAHCGSGPHCALTSTTGNAVLEPQCPALAGVDLLACVLPYNSISTSQRLALARGQPYIWANLYISVVKKEYQASNSQGNAISFQKPAVTGQQCYSGSVGCFTLRRAMPYAIVLGPFKTKLRLSAIVQQTPHYVTEWQGQ